MRKFFILLTVIILIVSLSVSALAADSSRLIYYLYRDFKPVTQNSDGTIVRRLTLDPSNMFGSLSSLSSANYKRQIGMQQFSFDGLYGSSYWVNIEVLGVFSDDIYDSSIWSKKNLISLDGFLTGSKLNFLYMLTGANIEDDHHDIWVTYYDANFNYTEQIQYQGTNTSVGNNGFMIEVPIGVGSNINNAYFSVMLQIDDIYPEYDGTVTLSLTGMTINTTGTASGGEIWEDFTPTKPPWWSDVEHNHTHEDQLAGDAFQGVDVFNGLSSGTLSGLLYFNTAISGIVTIMNKFIDLSIIGIILRTSLVFGLAAYFFNFISGGLSSLRRHGKSSGFDS